MGVGIGYRLRDYFFPVKVVECRRLMRKAPGWPRARLDDWARARRRAVAVHAFEHVRYYRGALGRLGIRADRVDDDEVWSRIPTLTKELVLENAESLVAAGVAGDRTVWAETSGSTGMKLRILLDGHVNAAAFALFWRAWTSGGHYRLGQRHAVLKGHAHPGGWRYNRAIRALELSSVALEEETARRFRALILRYRPRFLRGYPSAMYLLCRLLREQGEALHLPMIVSGSETLHAFQRVEIERFLGARLYNHYTHWERAASILECEAGRLHAQEDYGHHEILDAEGRPCPPGVVGEITATSLHNRAMPLIRYRTGDMAAWSAEACVCGQSFPVVERIEGRWGDYLVTPSGRPISATAASAGLDRIPQILYSQLVQSTLDRVEVRVVRAVGYRHPEVTDRIRRDLGERLGPEIALEIRFCGLDELERSPAGKIRQCFSHVPADARGRFAGSAA